MLHRFLSDDLVGQLHHGVAVLLQYSLVLITDAETPSIIKSCLDTIL